MLSLSWIIVIAALAVALVVSLITLYRETKTNSGSTSDIVSDVEMLLPIQTPDFQSSTGFRLTSYPDDELLVPKKFYVAGGDTAQVEYKVIPDTVVTLRVAESGKLRIPPEYDLAEYEVRDPFMVNETVVTKRQSAGRRAIVEWTKDGFDYVFYAEAPEMNLMGGISDDFVTKTSAEKAS